MASVKRNADVKCAMLPGVQGLLTATAHRIKATGEALAAESIQTGNYASSFGVETVPGERGVEDRLVYNDDEAAVVIEYGHLTPPTEKSPGTYVPGKHILRRAIGR